MRSVSGILLFDGYCILCSSFVSILLKKFDASLIIVAMQSSKGLEYLKKYSIYAEPDEVILVHENSVFKGVRAILFLMKHGGFPWSFLEKTVSFFPETLLVWLYRRVADNRYFIFGKRKMCYRPRS